jgi:hypothetical protein
VTDLLVRRLLIDLEAPFARHWNGGDAFRSAFFNALSNKGRAMIWPEFDAINIAAPPGAIWGKSFSTSRMVAMKLMANTRLPSAMEGDTPAACTKASILRAPRAATILAG